MCSDPPPPPPNGTGFTILTQPSPELDATNLVVGR
jgi:peptidyl-prolyl cis-trans isomerase B (cyclophilin B)